jgi:hypothetical protein
VKGILSWTNPSTYTDGTAMPASDLAGIEIQFDGAGVVSVPGVIGQNAGFDLNTLASYSSLKHGPHALGLAVVSKGGVASAFANAVTFQTEGTPMAPTDVVVA